jgi:type VI secretion system secreted protein Hcp
MRKLGLGTLLAAVLSASASHAAEPVSVFLKANGVLVPGDSSQQSLGREKTAKGSTTIAPIDVRCTKAVDRSSPSLLRALAQQHSIELEARFFRPSPYGDGTTQQYFTVFGLGGTVIDIAGAASTDSALPAMEEVTIRLSMVRYVFNDGDNMAQLP